MIILKRKAPILLILLISITFVVPSISYGIVLNNVDKFSKSSILIDQDTGRVLYEKNPDEKRPLASLSKMMTFLIAIEAINNKEVNKDDIIVIDKDIAKVRGSSYHLKVGEEVPLIELTKSSYDIFILNEFNEKRDSFSDVIDLSILFILTSLKLPSYITLLSLSVSKAIKEVSDDSMLPFS